MSNEKKETLKKRLTAIDDLAIDITAQAGKLISDMSPGTDGFKFASRIYNTFLHSINPIGRPAEIALNAFADHPAKIAIACLRETEAYRALIEALANAKTARKGSDQNILEPSTELPNFEKDSKLIILLLAVIAIGYASDAKKANDEHGVFKGKQKYATSFLCDATRYSTLALFSFALKQQGVLGVDILSASARKAANARHAENHAMKAEVIAYYIENQHNFKSLDAAAEAIAGKVVPVTFRTVRGWIAGHRKKLQSARRV